MTPTEFAALAVIQLLGFTRLLQATKGAWGFIPPAYQWLPATLLTIATEVTAKLQAGVHTWLDVAVPIVLVLSTVLPGARSNVHSALQALADKAADDEDNPIHASTVQRVTRGNLSARAAATGTLVMMVLLFLLPGCATLKPIARTTNDVAGALCSQFFSEKQGVSLEDAARTFCRTREQLDPWVEQILAAKHAAGAAAVSRMSAKDGGGG